MSDKTNANPFKDMTIGEVVEECQKLTNEHGTKAKAKIKEKFGFPVSIFFKGRNQITGSLFAPNLRLNF